MLDETLGKKLEEIGYKGIEELNKYYLDFYNKKYNLECKNLEDLPANVISEIFNGNNYPIKESNLEIAELGYNYWYNVLFSVLFGDEKYDYKTSNLSAIGSYMRNKELGNDYFTKDLGIINPLSENSLTTMNFYINGEIFRLIKDDILIVNSKQIHYGYEYNHDDCKFICLMVNPSVLKINKAMYQEYVIPII